MKRSRINWRALLGQKKAEGEDKILGQEHHLEKAKRYSRTRVLIFIVDLAATIVSLIAFYAFLSRPILTVIYGVTSNFYITLSIFTFIFLSFNYFVNLPFHFIGSFLVEKHFNLSNQNLLAWLSDEAKGMALGFILSTFCIISFYAILRNFSSSWWLISAICWMFLSIVLVRLLPILIIPLFFKYSPIDDGEIKKGIMDLARKANFKLMDVCKIDFSKKTVKANAALVGLGSTRKVILADTLLKNFTKEEALTVVAHELGHFRHKHMWKLLAFSAVATLTAFLILFAVSGKVIVFSGASGLSDLRLLPIFMLLGIIFNVAVMPLANLVSRKLERQADRFSLDIAASPEVFISVMRKLASMNLSDISPSRLQKIFFYDHPPISERIKMAEGYRC